MRAESGQEIILYDYWRSSACYRVRIGLKSAGLSYQTVSINLLEGHHKSVDYQRLNPQGLVPCLQIDGKQITQSLAILEYMDETRNLGFLPQQADARARVRSLSYAIAMDIHPICNMHVVTYVSQLLGDIEKTRQAWMEKFIMQGLVAFEGLLEDPQTGDFCHGDCPSLADFCLVPQIYNARRFNISLKDFPHIEKINANCLKLDSFHAAAPEQVRPNETL